jgi:hypothetical protein
MVHITRNIDRLQIASTRASYHGVACGRASRRSALRAEIGTLPESGMSSLRANSWKLCYLEKVSS